MVFVFCRNSFIGKEINSMSVCLLLSSPTLSSQLQYWVVASHGKFQWVTRKLGEKAKRRTTPRQLCFYSLNSCSLRKALPGKLTVDTTDDTVESGHWTNRNGLTGSSASSLTSQPTCPLLFWKINRIYETLGGLLGTFMCALEESPSGGRQWPPGALSGRSGKPFSSSSQSQRG